MVRFFRFFSDFVYKSERLREAAKLKGAGNGIFFKPPLRYLLQ